MREFSRVITPQNVTDDQIKRFRDTFPSGHGLRLCALALGEEPDDFALAESAREGGWRECTQVQARARVADWMESARLDPPQPSQGRIDASGRMRPRGWC